MLSERLEEALNRQINAELYSAYLYLSMEAYFRSVNLEGFARWMRAQALEEMTHADRFAKYISNRQGRVVLDGIARPPVDWDSPRDVFEKVLEHERKVTALIFDLVALAEKEKDYSTGSMLQWFVNEQVEEEATAEGILGQLKLVGDNGNGLLMIDRELGTRVFAPEPPAGR
ncbi:MAG TPA: ferritin [Deltaproteobacteria bacterium]|nr:ferritin [Deltaproteobacteria bacterium]HOM28057.1 ferritin [Deltaproteobacteria bacterium]HPP80715.1 ferritin [Deltaproteobacteria bacterium]